MSSSRQTLEKKETDMKMKNVLLITFLYILSIPMASAMGGKDEYKLVWKEDFKEKSIDDGKWSKIPRGKSDWNRYMSSHESLYEIKKGKLILHGIVNNGVEPNDTAKFLTGGVFTKGKLSMRYGKVEIKAKLEGAQGAWPAIWMLPEKGKWPNAGEIDILERLNHDGFVYQTVHTHYTFNLKEKNNPPHSGKADIKGDKYNIYGVEILPDKIVFSVNGKVTHTYPKIDTDKEGQFPFGTPYYILIDMQIEGAWVGKANIEELPVKMMIDWVKVYEKL